MLACALPLEGTLGEGVPHESGDPHGARKHVTPPDSFDYIELPLFSKGDESRCFLFSPRTESFKVKGRGTLQPVAPSGMLAFF